MDDYTCPLCFDIFTNPLSLTCGHSLCATCIEGLFAFAVLKQSDQTLLPTGPKKDNGQQVQQELDTTTVGISCVTCNEKTLLKKYKGIKEQLQINRNLDGVCSKKREVGTPCEGDSNHTATIHCDNCEVSFCQKCFDENHPTPILKRHKTSPVDEQEPTRNCQHHTKEKLEFFCTKCQQMVCSKCNFLKEHREHTGSFIPMEEYRDECKKELLEMKKSLADTLQSVKDKKVEVIAEIKDTNIEIEETIKKMEATLRQLKEKGKLKIDIVF